MPAGKARAHVRQLLNYGDVDRLLFRQFTSLLATSTGDDALRVVSAWVEDELTPLGLNLREAFLDDRVLDALAATRLGVMSRICAADIRRPVDEFTVASLSELLDGFEPGFSTELISEIQRRKTRQSEYTNVLVASRAAVLELARSIEKLGIARTTADAGGEGETPDDGTPTVVAASALPAIIIGVVVFLLYAYWLTRNVPKSDDDDDGADGDSDE